MLPIKSITLRATFITAALLIASVSAHAVVFGDLTGDGKVNVADVTLALQIAVGLVRPTLNQTLAGDVEPVSAAGVFGNGKIDVSDGTRILRRVAGLEPDASWPGLASFNQPLPRNQGVLLPAGFALSVNADLIHDFSLPAGFKLHGKVSGPGKSIGESITIIDPSSHESISTKLAADDTYAVGLPNGHYQIVYSTSATNQTVTPGQPGMTPVPVPGPPAITHLDIPLGLAAPIGVTVPVIADTPLNITRPAVPPLFKVSGKVTVAGQAIQPPFILSMTPNDADASAIPAGPAGSSTVTSLDGRYIAFLPAGAYQARINLIDPRDFAPLRVSLQPLLQVGGDTVQNLSAAYPALHTLAGAVTLGGAVPPDITATVYSSVDPAKSSGSATSSDAAVVKGGLYQAALDSGTYGLTLRFSDEGISTGIWSLDVGRVDVTRDVVKAIPAPAVPSQRVRVKGRVLGPDGLPIHKGSVSFSSTRLDAAFSGYTFSITTQVMADGSYAVSVPPGAYNALVRPDNGFPVAFIPPPGFFPDALTL